MTHRQCYGCGCEQTATEKVRLSDGSYRTVKRCLSCGIIVGETGASGPDRYGFNHVSDSVVGLVVEHAEGVRGLPALTFADGTKLVVADTDAVWFEAGGFDE